MITGLKKSISYEGILLIVAHGGVHWVICQLLSVDNDHPWAIDNCQVAHFSPILQSQWKAEILSYS